MSVSWVRQVAGGAAGLRFSGFLGSWRQSRTSITGAPGVVREPLEAKEHKMTVAVCVAGVTGWAGRAVPEAVQAADDLRLTAGSVTERPASRHSTTKAAMPSGCSRMAPTVWATSSRTHRRPRRALRRGADRRAGGSTIDPRVVEALVDARADAASSLLRDHDPASSMSFGRWPKARTTPVSPPPYTCRNRPWRARQLDLPQAGSPRGLTDQPTRHRFLTYLEDESPTS
jgi:hypothetical protein